LTAFAVPLHATPTYIHSLVAANTQTHTHLLTLICTHTHSYSHSHSHTHMLSSQMQLDACV